jgi:hypothetical protein
MSVSIALRVDFDASRVRGLAKKAKDGPQARRLLALAAIYDGATRSEAAKIPPQRSARSAHLDLHLRCRLRTRVRPKQRGMPIAKDVASAETSPTLPSRYAAA